MAISSGYQDERRDPHRNDAGDVTVNYVAIESATRPAADINRFCVENMSSHYVEGFMGA